MKSLLPLASTLIAASVLSACIINVDSHSVRTGRYVSAETLRQIEPGRTQDYVLALIGDPSSKSQLENGIEIWKWTYSETRRREGRLIFVFSGDESQRVDGATYVEFQDRVVKKSWQD
ncbi:MAG: outer membrane protein assembly factor BamE [Planctomycetes bacterium]|nr:outer membrane protein assembly factor BamE [Planctomycetota bacterium]